MRGTPSSRDTRKTPIGPRVCSSAASRSRSGLQPDWHDETVAYARHLLENYDHAPELTVFLHGTAPRDWHSPPRVLNVLAMTNVTALLRVSTMVSTTTTGPVDVEVG